MQTKKYSLNFFRKILSESIDRVIKGESADSLLWKYPDMASELEPLIRTALLIKMINKIQAPAEFKARATLEFQTVLGNTVKSV